MAVFTVHVPPGTADPIRRADRTIFVREGFSIAAFVFGPLFLIYRRLWLAALGWFIVAILLGAAARLLHLSEPSLFVLFLLLGLMTGLEVSAFRQAALRRRGYIFAALLTSPNREGAERAYFAGEGLRPPPPRPVTGQKVADTEVIGLFPNAGDLA